MKVTKAIAFAFVLCLPVLFSGCGIKKKVQDVKGGVYRSDNAALSFEQKANLAGGGSIGAADIFALTLDPGDSKILYAGSPSGVYRSEDRGESWLKDNNNFQNVRDVEVNPNDTNEIYMPATVNGVGKIMKTTNGGNDWQEVFTQRTKEGSVFNIAMNPKRPQELFAGDSGGALYKTSDAGATWKTVLWEKSGINIIKFDSINTDKLYFVTTRNGAKRSDDGGEGFVPISDKGTIYNLVPHPYQEGTIFLSDEAGLHKSVDGGNTLEIINTLVRPEDISSRGIAIDPKNDKIIYFVSGNAIYKTENGGESWKPIQFSVPSRRIESIVVDPENTETIYLGTRKVAQKRGLFPF